MGIALPPRLARDPSALPPFRKFISGFALTKTLRLSVFKQTNQENFARISEEGTRERS
jgi:hypothetical protein